MKRIVIFGAGAVGRGLIGKIFADTGHRVCFIEKDQDLSWLLSANQYYRINLDGFVATVAPVTCLSSYAKEFVENEIRQADVIFVSVRKENLSEVSQILKSALNTQELLRKPIIIVENVPNVEEESNKILRVDGPSLKINPNCYPGIANCVIPEVPEEIKQLDPTFLYGDSEGYLCLPKSVQEEWMPDSIDFTDNFQLAWDMKWYLHCAFHLIVGLLGCKYEKEFVYQVFADERLRNKLIALENDIAVKLSMRYVDNSDYEKVTERAHDEIVSMARRGNMPDTCKRLIRDLARKMEDGERIDALKKLLSSNSTLDEAIDYAMEAVA